MRSLAAVPNFEAEHSGSRAASAFYADKRPAHRIGIIPDVEVRRTIVRIRGGRDEVLEEAIRRVAP